ncbi:MAG: outer membrane beta-barrel protein [Ferruginibacter sp.]
MRIIYTLAALLLFSTGAIAQSNISIRGIVKNAEGRSLSNASVILYYKGRTDTLKTVSDDKGIFVFKNVLPKNVAVLVSYVGYKTFSNSYDFNKANGEQSIFDIVMNPGDNLLEGVTLESNKVQIKEDTVSFLIDSTMYRKNDNVEEVLKKLPGVQVDKDGTVTAQGKQVTKVKVNGKEFFGGDVTTATREINADMVDRIQVIDDYGDQSAFTGVKDGDPSKTLNIQLKKDKNKGYFGNVTAGGGTEGRYLSSVSVNKFNNNQQVSLLGNLNNTNASTFNFGSMGGAMGNMIGGMVRSLGIGKSGSAASALGNFGNNDGIATTKSIGLNYRDEWGPKVSAYGSYSFSRRGTSTIKNITQQNIFNDSSSTNLQNSNDYTINDNHRVSFNIEYKIDSFNYLKFTPSYSYNESTSDVFSDFLFLGNNGLKNNDGTSKQASKSSSPNLNGNLLFNHRFAKRGRTLSLNLSGGKSSSGATNDYQNLSTLYFPNNTSADIDVYQHIIQDNKNNNYGVRASYIEPMSKKRSLEFNYAYNRQFTGNDKETFNVDPVTGAKTYSESQSNIYNNVYITNKFGLNFRTNEKKYNYTIGLAVQPASIQSNSVTGKYDYTQHLLNYYPVIRFAYNFSRSRSFNINYNGNTSQPSYSQLQPVTDSSNQQYITVGNPNLKPEFTNTLSMRYNNFDFITGNVFFSNISVSFTRDKIVNNTIDRGFGRQETRYLNSDGYYTAFGFYNFSKPIQNRKYVFNIGGNITYNNNVSFVDSKKNKGTNWLVGQRFATDIKIKKWIETTIGVNYSLNSSKYSLQTENSANTDAAAWTLSHSSRFFLPYNFKFNYDIDKSFNSGYAANVNSDPLIINATLEKALFKKQNASIKLQAFDLLNENTSIYRSVTGSAVTDTRTNKLGRYFMLSFIFRLNKFSGQSQSQMMPGMPGGNMQMMRPPGM